MTDLTPGPDLDCLFAERVEGWTDLEEEKGWGVAPGNQAISRIGSPFQEVPRFSRDDSTALAALERFADTRNIWWEMQRAPRRYSVRLIGEGMPIYAQTAKTLAHAIVLALLAAVELRNDG